MDLGAFGCRLGSFRETFCHFWEVCGVLLDGTPSRAKTYISWFGRSLDGACSTTFPGVDFREGFYEMLYNFYDLGEHWGSLWSPLDAPFKVNRAPGSRMGSKVAPGSPKRSLWVSFLMVFQRISGAI